MREESTSWSLVDGRPWQTLIKTYECAAFNKQNSQNIFWGGHSPFQDILCEEGAHPTPFGASILMPLALGPCDELRYHA